MIVDGLKRVLAALPQADWEKVLWDILAGLWFVPSKVGYLSYVAVFKQAPVLLLSKVMELHAAISNKLPLEDVLEELLRT